MRDYEDAASTCLSQSPASRSHRRRRLRIGGLVLAFMVAIGMGLSTSATRAEALASRITSSFQTLAVSDRGPINGQQGTSTAGENGQCDGTGSNSRPINGQQGTSTPGDNGQCSTFTVSSVNGSTIVAQSSCSRSITVHTTASTQYVQAGRNVSVSAITVGSRVYVAGSQNSDGSITASRIDIN